MEKAKKSKKKLIAIIAGAAMAFVLTVAVSVGATLAYFGNNVTANNTVKMGGSVVAGSPKVLQANLTDVVPGQKVNSDIQVTVTSSSTANAYLKAIVTLTADKDVDLDVKSLTPASTWTAIGTIEDGATTAEYYYGTADKLTKISATTTGAQVIFNNTGFTMSTALKNDVADATITITVKFVAIQDVVVDGQVIAEPTYAQAADIFTAVAAYAA